MATLSITTSPVRERRCRRKITVNERVERILHDALQSEEPRTATADARDEAKLRRSRQLSTLYTSSVDDKFLRSRLRDGSGSIKSVPKNAHVAHLHTHDAATMALLHTRVDQEKQQLQLQQTSSAAAHIAASPIKPVRCYAKMMLQQQHERDEGERKLIESAQFREPDFSPPKPWYSGYSSPHKAPHCTVDAKIRRYGAYGAVKMLASESVAGTAPPFLLRESQSLNTLVYRDEPDAWSPTLHGSPTLWPEAANFATGSKLAINKMLRCPSPNHRFPSHVVGKTEPNPHDAHYTHMQYVHSQDVRALEIALEDDKARRRREIGYNKEKFEHWKAQLQFEPLSDKMDHPFIKVNATRAKELTILHKPEYAATTKFQDHVDRLTNKRFALRWRNMAILLDVMKRTACRRPVLQDIEKLYALSYELSLKNLNPLELTRQQFLELWQREYPMLQLKHANRLYSSYDCRMEDKLDMRMFLSTVRALRVQQGTTIEIVTLALQDFDLTKKKIVSRLSHFESVLTLCCGSEDEEREIKRRAADMWTHMLDQYARERESRRQRLLCGEVMEANDDGEGDSYGVDDELDGDADTVAHNDDAQSEVESLLFLGCDDEQRPLPIKFVRKVLRQEKELLRCVTELMLRRREQCFASAPPKTRGGNPLAAADEIHQQ